MSNQIILKKSSVTAKVPVAGDLVYGELALNYADGKLYYKDSSNVIKSFTNDTSTVTLTGTQTLTNKTLTTPVVDRIDWAASGTGAPTTTTRSAGTKLTLYPSVGASSVDYAIGINAATLWSSIPTNASDHYFKWYGGTTQVASLSGTGVLTVGSISNPTITGTLTAGGGVGTNNQVLKSTGSAITWADNSIQTLSDVQIASKTTQDVLTWNGSYWVASAPNTVVVSALFSSTATDFGYVYDAVTLTEDVGLISSAVTTYYDLAILSFTGIISLNNLDQSVKSDYLGYSIIFGF